MNTTQTLMSSLSNQRWLSWLADGFGWKRPPRKTLLHVRELPPHLQRDLGILDGNDPCGRRR